MIVRPLGASADVVTQVDHAVLSGRLAEAWGGPAVPPLEPRESLIAAARLHDIGWRHWEAAPRLNPDNGRPANFLDVVIDEHLRLYRLGIDEVEAVDRHAGMLVAMHAAGIYTGRFGTQPALLLTRAPAVQSLVDAFVAEQQSRVRAAQDALGVSDDALWRAYVLLQVFDRLSLRLCGGDPAGSGPMEIALPDDGVLAVARDEDGAERLDPWPFATEALALEVPTRTIPLEGHGDDAALLAALDAAPIALRPVLLLPA